MTYSRNTFLFQTDIPYVCPETSGILEATPSIYAGNVTYTGTTSMNFSCWTGNATSVDQLVTWPTHVFVNANVGGALVGVDLMGFVWYVLRGFPAANT